MKKNINTYKDLLTEVDNGTKAIQINKEFAEWLEHNVDCKYITNKELLIYGLNIKIEVV